MIRGVVLGVLMGLLALFVVAPASAQTGCTVTVDDGRIIVSSVCVVVTMTPVATPTALPTDTPTTTPTATPVPPTATLVPPTPTPVPTATSILPTVTPSPTATATVTPTPSPTATPIAPTGARSGIWISQAEIDALPMSGPGWNELIVAANSDPGAPSLANQDSNNSTSVMAEALVCARTKIASYCDKVRSALRAVATGNLESGARALALGRELIGYVLAADIANLKQIDPALDTQFRNKLRYLLTYRTTQAGSLIDCDNDRPNNWGGHCGASRIAADLYLGDRADLDKAANVLRGWMGDRAVYAKFTYGALDWQADQAHPVGVNLPAATIRDHSVDGAQPEEMRRAGEVHFPPTFTDYGWEGLQGRVASTRMLSRAGYPDAWQWCDRAILRATQYLYSIEWPAVGDDQWQIWIINKAYGVGIPTTGGGKGKNVGWSMWTDQ